MKFTVNINRNVSESVDLECDSISHFLELIKNFDEVESLRKEQKEKYSEICGEILSTTYLLKDSDCEYEYDEELDKIISKDGSSLIIYSCITEAPPAEYFDYITTQLSNGQYLNIRHAYCPLHYSDALDAALPRVGETILNTIPFNGE